MLTQCRDHIIRRTFEAVKGAAPGPSSTLPTPPASPAAGGVPQVQGGDQANRRGAKLIKELSRERGQFLFEYSPELRGTEPYAVGLQRSAGRCSPRRTVP
ncbi:MAG: hypothetical protein ACLTYN_09120 [Dysosmobacter welbionis]